MTINLKINRVFGHQQGYIAFEIGVYPFSRFGHVLIWKIFGFQTLTSRHFVESILNLAW